MTSKHLKRSIIKWIILELNLFIFDTSIPIPNWIILTTLHSYSKHIVRNIFILDLIYSNWFPWKKTVVKIRDFISVFLWLILFLYLYLSIYFMAEVGDYDSGLKYSGHWYSTTWELDICIENAPPSLIPPATLLSFREGSSRIPWIIWG